MRYRFDQRRRRRWPWIVTALSVLVIGGGMAAWFLFVPHSPVPAVIKGAVNFPIYYPEQSKLPAGYTLDKTSFTTANNQAAMYIIRYGAEKKLVVTVQKRPSDDDIAAFYKQTIPIHKEVLTTSGKAVIGAIDQQAVASLPTNDSAWLLITGPADINKDELSRVLQAMTKG